MRNTSHMQSIVYFRAFGALMVAASHCYGYTKLKPDGIIECFFSLFIAGSTAYFVFIAGFIFHNASISNFNFLNFMRKKLQYVLVPFTILSTLALLPVFNWKTPDFDIISLIKYYGNGNAFQAYWYIPFSITFFLLSPAFIYFSKMKPGVQGIALAMLTTCAMLAFRSKSNDNHIQSIIYFAPVFMTGILTSKNFAFIKSAPPVFIVFVTACLLIVTLKIAYTGIARNVVNDIFNYQYLGFDLSVLQKMLFSVLCITLLEKVYLKSDGPIVFISKVSFAIYLLHPWILKIFGKFPESLNIFQSDWMNFFFVAMLVIFTSIIISVAVKYVIGEKSRYIIGY